MTPMLGVAGSTTIQPTLSMLNRNSAFSERNNSCGASSEHNVDGANGNYRVRYDSFASKEGNTGRSVGGGFCPPFAFLEPLSHCSSSATSNFASVTNSARPSFNGGAPAPAGDEDRVGPLGLHRTRMSSSGLPSSNCNSARNSLVMGVGGGGLLTSNNLGALNGGVMGGGTPALDAGAALQSCLSLQSMGGNKGRVFYV